MLQVKSAVIEFGVGLRALDGVNFSVEAKLSHALLGSNGSGKTSLFNAICGYYRLKEGSIHLDGRDLGRLKSHERAALGVGRSLQSVAAIQELTPREYIAVGLHTPRRYLDFLLPTPGILRANKAELQQAGDLLRDVGLHRYADTPLQVCPYGVRKLVDVVRVFAGKPKLALLDEPSSGVSNSDKPGLAELIRNESSRSQSCMILIDHDIEFVRQLCPTATVLAGGKVIAEGRLNQILHNQDVIATFLGQA